MKKIIFNTFKIMILMVVIIICSSNKSNFVSQITNNNLNKTVNLSQMAMKVSEFNYDELYSAKDTYTGDLTGYVYNCPACTGHLACNSNYDLTGGINTYNDPQYGAVYIVASSSNLPCGTIIRFNSSRISSSQVIAIVMDRGVLGNAIDFLSPNYDYAVQLGRSTITYDVLRSGW